MKHIHTKSATKALSISESKGATLNKDQKTFNRLVKKIEQLRVETEELTTELNSRLKFYSDELHPKEKEIAQLRAEITKKVYPFYCEKKLLNKGDKKIIKHFFITQLEGIIPFMELDDVLSEIFKEAHGSSFEEVRQEEFEEMREEMKEMFDSMGVKMNLDDFTADMSEEDVARKMHEFMHEMKQKVENQEAHESTKKKTKKQLAKEELEKQKEALRNTSIGKIYKSLAKAFHPDLERDADKIAEKEELMKRLTVAYESNDLHTLLSLEMEWIKKEEGNIELLSDEKLRLYNQILKEQAQEIEDDMLLLAEHPRYQPLKAFYPPYLSPIDWHEFTLRRFSTDMKELIKQIKATIKSFDRDPLKVVREIVKEYHVVKNQPAEIDNIEELLDMLIQRKGR